MGRNIMHQVKRTYIIAEAGVNHNGDVNMALQLIKAAKDAGADCIKFQTFKAAQIVTAEAPKALYQQKVTPAEESQFEMLKKLELDQEDFSILLKECKSLGIDFLSTPYNLEDADLLAELDVTGFKIASGQLTEIPFLQYVAAKGRQMILSTGMSNIADVFTAVQAVREAGNNDIIVLQCTTNYPSLISDANVLAMLSIADACKVRVGYSDHVPENHACYAAVALGAEVIEKHFTLDKHLPGPDHSSSLTPSEFAELVQGIRKVESALGNGLKIPTETEKQNMYGMKRSLVALTDLPAGTVLSKEHIGFKRPFNGLPPAMLVNIIGKKIAKPLKKDEPIQYNTVVW
jgi:N,N'-diacetyllegionaminate synthase